jgi:hypothetical protein
MYDIGDPHRRIGLAAQDAVEKAGLIRQGVVDPLQAFRTREATLPDSGPG